MRRIACKDSYFASGEELLAGIWRVLGEIPLETFVRVFGHWMEKREWLSQNTPCIHAAENVSFAPAIFGLILSAHIFRTNSLHRE
jgi:hypothetical protein